MFCMNEVGILMIHVKDIFQHTQYQSRNCHNLSKGTNP